MTSLEEDNLLRSVHLKSGLIRGVTSLEEDNLLRSVHLKSDLIRWVASLEVDNLPGSEIRPDKGSLWWDGHTKGDYYIVIFLSLFQGRQPLQIMHHRMISVCTIRQGSSQNRDRVYHLEAP